jgi:hypothetical protein
MNLLLIEGLSAVGISLLILGLFVGNQKEKTTADMSSHGLVRDLRLDSDASSMDSSVRSGSYPNSEDTHTFGGKRKNKKTRRKK